MFEILVTAGQVIVVREFKVVVMNSACVESDSGSSCCVQVSTEVGEYGKGGHIVGDDSQLESVLKKSSKHE